MILLTRRAVGLALLALLAACAAPSQDATRHPPIVFVHGNGDTAALWMTTLWRFESNGWPRERLHAIDLPYPLARDEDDKPQEGRSSSSEHARFLAAEVERVRAATHADKVVLMANSRGATACATTSPTSAARSSSRTPSSAAARITACGTTRPSGRRASSTARGRC